MKVYYLDEFKSIEQYNQFMQYMLLKSDTFSLVYFKYRENEKMKKTTKKIYDSLKKYRLFSKKTNNWPNTENLDTDHIYNFVMYSSEERCLETLLQVQGIYGWDYPDAPMDLCFYRNGYCWLAVTAHERMAYLYTDNLEEVEKLQSLGAELTYENSVSETLFCRTMNIDTIIR